MMDKKRDYLVTGLVAVIIILLLILSYVFIVSPALKSWKMKNQAEGVEYAITLLFQQALTCDPIPLNYNNQTINLIALECLQGLSQNVNSTL